MDSTRYINAVFTDGDSTKAESAYQYDYGLYLRIQGLNLPAVVEVHFALKQTGGEAVARVGTTKDGVTDVLIPKSMLANDGVTKDFQIYAWIYVTDEESGRTEYQLQIPVKSRSKPSEPEGQNMFADVIADVNEAVANASAAAVAAQSWAVGGTGTREDEDLANAQYCVSVAMDESESAYQSAERAEKSAKSAEAARQSVVQIAGEEVASLNAVAAEQIEKIEEAGKKAGAGINNFLSNYFAVRRNGKVFTTKIYKYDTSTSPVGVKMNANENMVAEPSVGMTEGRDDYAQYGLFRHFTCNFSMDTDGVITVDALEGQPGFSKSGKVQVGEVTMSAWFGVEDTADAVLYHYSDSQTELTPYPMKESINPDGTISPFMIHPKYVAGGIDGELYSSKGLAPASGCKAEYFNISRDNMGRYMPSTETDGGYNYYRFTGTTHMELFYRQLMMIIKYATTDSQSIMAGCTDYDYQNQNLVEEAGVTRVVLTKEQADEYVIGSYVSIGDIGTNTDKGRVNAYMHNKAFSVEVTKIEDVDDNNAAVYVDATEAFDTTLTTWISTMPWHSGATDAVIGSDGSPNSNTSGKDPYKIQGIETCIGASEVLSNVTVTLGTLSGWYYKESTVEVSGTTACVKMELPFRSDYISEEVTDPALGIMIPTECSGSESTGFADAVRSPLYDGSNSVSQYSSFGVFGDLSSKKAAGLWYLHWQDRGVASWNTVTSVSPNGYRGKWQANA